MLRRLDQEKLQSINFSSGLLTPVVLLNLTYSPLALRLDRFSRGCNLIGRFLQAGAWLLSKISGKTTVELRVSETSEFNLNNLSPWDIVESAHIVHDWLLSGCDATLNLRCIPVAILLVWGFSSGSNRGLMDTYSAIKRKIPDCYITVAQTVSLPMTYAMYRDGAYWPSSELLEVVDLTRRVRNE